MLTWPRCSWRLLMSYFCLLRSLSCLCAFHVLTAHVHLTLWTSWLYVVSYMHSLTLPLMWRRFVRYCHIATGRDAIHYNNLWRRLNIFLTSRCFASNIIISHSGRIPTEAMYTADNILVAIMLVILSVISTGQVADYEALCEHSHQHFAGATFISAPCHFKSTCFVCGCDYWNSTQLSYSQRSCHWPVTTWQPHDWWMHWLPVTFARMQERRKPLDAVVNFYVYRL